MRKVVMILALIALAMTMATPAFADSPGIKIINGWMAGPTGIDFAGFIGQSSGNVAVITGPNGVPTQDQMQIDSVAAIEAAYKINATGVESALGTFNNDTPVAYTSGLIAYMVRAGFNPAVVGGPNIPPGSVTQAMMPNGYLLIDQIGQGGWAVQLNPGQTPKPLAGVVTAPAPALVTKTTPAPVYVKPLLSEVQFKLTPQEVATTSPSVSSPGKGSAAPVKLTPVQQKAVALHVPESYVTNPAKVHRPVVWSFPWKWVYIGGGALLLIIAAVVLIMRNRRDQYGW